MYSFPNLEPVYCSMSRSNCCFLTYRFLGRQVRWSGIPISWRIFQFFVIHTVKGISVINEAEVDVFLVFSCFIYDQMDAGNLICGSTAFSKSSLNIWKFSVHVLLKSHLENFEHYFASVWNECNCVVVWTFKFSSGHRTGKGQFSFQSQRKTVPKNVKTCQNGYYQENTNKCWDRKSTRLNSSHNA